MWKLFFDYYLSPYGKTLLFECNFRQSDIISISYCFIQQICNAWSLLHFNDTVENYETQILWNNSFIKIDGCVTYDKRLHMAGVIYVRDLFNENNINLSFNDFCNKYNIRKYPFTRYYGILSAIPNDWKLRMVMDRVTLPNENNLIVNINSRTAYNSLIENIALPPRALTKWNIYFSFSTDDWKIIFRIPKLTLSETKIIYFQFKFLHRILATNK